VGMEIILSIGERENWPLCLQVPGAATKPVTWDPSLTPAEVTNYNYKMAPLNGRRQVDHEDTRSAREPRPMPNVQRANSFQVPASTRGAPMNLR